MKKTGSFAVVTPLSLLLLLLLVSCGAGSAGKAVRPDDPNAANAIGGDKGGGGGGGGSATISCTTVPNQVEPLVVDWNTSAQLDLGMAMNDGIVLVAYDCKSISVVKDCRAPAGKYSFTAIPSLIEEAVKLRDADEAKASLPFSGAKIGGSIARGSSLDIALAYVGKRSAQEEAVAQSALTGANCKQATHFVRRATVGAYVMATNTSGDTRAAAEIFAAGGASASSTSTKARVSSAGDVSACKSIKDGDDHPPNGCAAILRLELQALSDRAPNVDLKGPLPNTCPNGFFMGAGGTCVKKSTDAAASSFTCDMTDPQECKDQCKKNNAGSCYNAGTIAEAGREPAPVTRALFKKSCDGNIGLGCLRWAKASEGDDWPSAEAGYRKSCSLGVPKACKTMASFTHNSPMKTTYADKAAFSKKACDLGDWEGCNDAVGLFFNGASDHGDDLPPKPEEGLKLLNGWCDAGRHEACGQLTGLYQDGQLWWGWRRKSPDFPKDPAKATSFKAKYCAIKGHAESRCK